MEITVLRLIIKHMLPLYKQAQGSSSHSSGILITVILTKNGIKITGRLEDDWVWPTPLGRV